MRLAALVAVVAIALTPRLAHGMCSCRELSQLEAFDRATFVVLARVQWVRTLELSIDSVPASLRHLMPGRLLDTLAIYEVTLVTGERLKGAPPDTLRVTTEYHSCSYFGPVSAPKVGERHLLFFYQSPAAVPLRQLDCAGSRPMEMIEPSILEALRDRRAAG